MWKCGCYKMVILNVWFVKDIMRDEYMVIEIFRFFWNFWGRRKWGIGNEIDCMVIDCVRNNKRCVKFCFLM